MRRRGCHRRVRNGALVGPAGRVHAPIGTAMTARYTRPASCVPRPAPCAPAALPRPWRAASERPLRGAGPDRALRRSSVAGHEHGVVGVPVVRHRSAGDDGVEPVEVVVPADARAHDVVGVGEAVDEAQRRAAVRDLGQRDLERPARLRPRSSRRAGAGARRRRSSRSRAGRRPHRSASGRRCPTPGPRSTGRTRAPVGRGRSTRTTPHRPAPPSHGRRRDGRRCRDVPPGRRRRWVPCPHGPAVRGVGQRPLPPATRRRPAPRRQQPPRTPADR